jgi:hypothetical protein
MASGLPGKRPASIPGAPGLYSLDNGLGPVRFSAKASISVGGKSGIDCGTPIGIEATGSGVGLSPRVVVSMGVSASRGMDASGADQKS